jgi:hypothetical protein
MHTAESKGLLTRRAAIAKLTVYHLAALIDTETALDGTALERDVDTERYESTDPEFITEALRRIEHARGTPTNDVCDARWGLVFSDAESRRITTFYLDAFGSTGILDGETVDVTEETLIEWLREKYGPDSVLT